MAEDYLTDDALAREVDKLLRKLPAADPYLKGDPEPPKGSRGVVTGEKPSVVLARRGMVGASRVQRISVWVRVVLGVLLALVITQWPIPARADSVSGCISSRFRRW